jgi:hypothetical protein
MHIILNGSGEPSKDLYHFLRPFAPQPKQHIILPKTTVNIHNAPLWQNISHDMVLVWHQCRSITHECQYRQAVQVNHRKVSIIRQNKQTNNDRHDSAQF